MSETKYIYFNRESLNNFPHNGIVCVGYRLGSSVNDEPTLDYVMTFCSPKDRFSKSIARKIINGRFNKGRFRKIQCPPITDGYAEPRYTDCLEMIKKDISASFELDSSKFPSWFNGIQDHERE